MNRLSLFSGIGGIDRRRWPALTPKEEVELDVRPATHGISRRMALKMLGNAVVPQQVYPILAKIAAYEKRPSRID